MDDDRRRALKGSTLQDDWEEDPDPPPDYGKPDPRTVIEEVAGIYYVWHTKNSDAQFQFEGDSVEVKE